jgi:hypothetical protein
MTSEDLSKVRRMQKSRAVIEMSNNFKVDVDDIEELLEVVPENLLELQQEHIAEAATAKETA